MKYPRREKLEELPLSARKSHLQTHIKFGWFIDEHSLLDSLLLLGLHHYNYGYLIDDDFAKYVFSDVTSTKDLKFICDRLEKESKDWCSKARFIRGVLNKPNEHKFWIKHPKYILSYVRRIHCGCHESGSLAKTV